MIRLLGSRVVGALPSGSSLSRHIPPLASFSSRHIPLASMADGEGPSQKRQRNRSSRGPRPVSAVQDRPQGGPAPPQQVGPAQHTRAPLQTWTNTPQQQQQQQQGGGGPRQQQQRRGRGGAQGGSRPASAAPMQQAPQGVYPQPSFPAQQPLYRQYSGTSFAPPTVPPAQVGASA